MPIPEHVKKYLPELQRWANRVRGLYGTPVYLVGSALTGSKPNPRDWDIRISMPDADFKIRFGDPTQWEREGNTGQWTALRWKWSDECVKQTKDAWRYTGLNVDFQIYPASHVRRLYPKVFPKLRIDTRPRQQPKKRKARR